VSESIDGAPLGDAGVASGPQQPLDPVTRAGPAGSRLTLPLAGGWSSQALVLVMLFVAGMAIHDLRPAGTAAGPGATAWLPWFMVAAGLTGGLVAATRLRAGAVDLIVALVGTAVGLVVIAGVASDAVSLTDRLHALEASIADALGDILVERKPTPEDPPFLLILAALAWTTGSFAAISVGRYARSTGAIVPIGLMLLVPGVLAELRDQDGGQLLWLAIGAGAALLLVLRLNLERQRVRWLRRHVSGGRSVGRAFLAGGAGLVAVVSLGAIGLTATMGSSPLSAGWDRLGTALGDLGVEVGQLRPPTSGVAGGYPDTMRLQDRWSPSDLTYFTASTTDTGIYWRGATYDTFDGRSWHRTGGVSTDVATGDDPLDATDDVPAVGTDGFREVDATITIQDMTGTDLVAPQNPDALDRPSRVWSMGEGGPFQVLEAPDGVDRGEQYWVSASEPDLEAGSPTRLTAAMLSEADDGSVPAWMRAFLRLPDQGVGRLTERTARAIEARQQRHGQDDRYHLALAVQRYLTGKGFRYDTQLGDLCPPGQTLTDCLLDSRRGFCERYATTMVMLLRLMDVPARYVVGFLPGREDAPGEYSVTGSAAHAWVEVWFDGFGWLRFDPTPGSSPAAGDLQRNGQQQTELLKGETGPNETFAPDEFLGPDETLDPNETFGPDLTDEPTPEPSSSPAAGAATTGDGTTGGTLPVELVAGGTALAVAALSLVALLWFRRFPAGGAERAWGGITGLAARFGRGPSPSQTPYEYTVTLSRVVPRVARDIREVADAKVTATYGPEPHAPSAASLRAAYARARTGLLALVLRRHR
jgi:transglutaminase-like putative cysteine protease